ncbi:hypothetical protein AVEN_64774-1 [Araneus ventricosus]|uniref:Uncharacterized protein n=1 Tax=Araneus ventricosus TaxID=182803 RepID=A0A4Y2UNE2_ARAVE|nr:hypothetical protein AVEN_64774-1 [Araneus ventricosus]
MLEEFKTSWNNVDTGRKTYSILPSVSLRPTNWINVVFFCEHGPFPVYFKIFHRSDSDQCSCVGTGMGHIYATEYAITVFWHIRKPAPNFEQD